MKGYELTTDKGSDIVKAMASVRMGGNVYYPSWLQFIRYPNNEQGEQGLPNSNAVLILADIVYWYRPILDRDEVTGLELPMRKRFKGRFLRKSRQELATAFGLSLKQVSTALDSLEACGVIKRHIIKREKLANGQTIYNVLEIELDHKRLEEITTPREFLKEVHKQIEFLQEFQSSVDRIPVGETYTENTITKNTDKGFVDAIAPLPKKKAKEGTTPKEESLHHQIIDAYVVELGYTPPKGWEMGKSAKWIRENGFTPTQVTECYRHLKRDKFWSKQPVSLQKVAEHLPDFTRRNNSAISANPYLNMTPVEIQAYRDNCEVLGDML